MGRRKRSKRQEEGRPDAGGRSPAARGRRWRVVAALATVALVVALVDGGLLFRGLSSGGSPPGPKTAVIVDQLSLTQPNPDFVEQATGLLQQGGYLVDYFPGEQVTVEFYRTLPSHGYDLLILRAHSAIGVERDVGTGEAIVSDHVGLFTGEPYDQTAHLEEQQKYLLGGGFYYEGGPLSFVISDRFVESSMQGSFDETLIVMMGCDGLRTQRTAQLFLDKGASAFVSWSNPVSAAHTDAATLRLLEKLLLEGLDASAAVSQTATEVGPDPVYGAELRVLSDDG